MAKTSYNRLLISVAFWLVFLGATHARELNFEERIEAQRLEEQISDLEKRYDLYSKKLESVKKRADDLDTRVNYVPTMCQGRLTPTSNTPVTVAETTANTTIYFTPYKGNYVTVYYRGQWRIMRFSQISLALSGTAANTIYDVFVYRASLGTLTLELSAAWANQRTRTDALTLKDGVYVKSSDNTRRYLGTVRTNASANQFDDSITSRGLWNYYNRVKIQMRVYDATNTWNYKTNTWREAGADTNNDSNFVIGINEVLCIVKVKTNIISNGGAARLYSIGVGVNTTTVNSAQLMGGMGNGSGGMNVPIYGLYYGYPGIGYNVLAYIEIAPSAARVNSWGDNGVQSATRSGYLAIIEG